jgi:hypothetical protein
LISDFIIYPYFYSMINLLKESLWKQFGASIDMLKNAIVLWPEERWDTHRKFFYTAYHCLVFLDYYLKIPAENLSSPLPFTLMEPANIPEGAVDDIIPDRIYSKQELLDYLQLSREKCREVIWSLTEEKLAERWVEQEPEGGKNFAILELLLYNMRHVQHHAAQLNMLLRLEINDAPRWVRSAKD